MAREKEMERESFALGQIKRFGPVKGGRAQCEQEGCDFFSKGQMELK